MTGDNKMSNERQKRNHRLDNIRAVAIIMIVLGHSIIIYSSSWNLYQTTVSVPVLDVLKDVINVMQLPIFFALSGYFFAYTLKKKNIVTIIRDKIKRLLVPFLAFGLLWLFPVRMLLDYPGYENAGLVNIIINKILFGSDNGHLWYLPTLFLIFIVYAFLMFFERKCIGEQAAYYCNFFAGICLYFLQMNITIPSYAGFFCRHFIWFSLGLIICNCNAHLVSLKGYVKFAFIITDVFCIAFYIFSRNNLALFISSILSVVIIFSLRLNFKNRLIDLISDNSYGLYLFHSPLIYITYTYFAESSPVFVVFMNFFLFGGLSLLFACLLRKSRFAFLMGEFS